MKPYIWTGRAHLFLNPGHLLLPWNILQKHSKGCDVSSIPYSWLTKALEESSGPEFLGEWLMWSILVGLGKASPSSTVSARVYPRKKIKLNVLIYKFEHKRTSQGATIQMSLMFAMKCLLFANTEGWVCRVKTESLNYEGVTFYILLCCRKVLILLVEDENSKGRIFCVISCPFHWCSLQIVRLFIVLHLLPLPRSLVRKTWPCCAPRCNGLPCRLRWPFLEQLQTCPSLSSLSVPQFFKRMLMCPSASDMLRHSPVCRLRKTRVSGSQCHSWSVEPGLHSSSVTPLDLETCSCKHFPKCSFLMPNPSVSMKKSLGTSVK